MQGCLIIEFFHRRSFIKCIHYWKVVYGSKNSIRSLAFSGVQFNLVFSPAIQLIHLVSENSTCFGFERSSFLCLWSYCCFYVLIHATDVTTQGRHFNVRCKALPVAVSTLSGCTLGILFGKFK